MSPAQPSSPPQRLVSQLLSENADLRDIVEQFVGGLSGRLEEFRQAYEALDWERLGLLAHRLKGAAGSYGYPDLGVLVAVMEQSFRAQQAVDFANWIKQFQDLVAAAQAGLQDDPDC